MSGFRNVSRGAQGLTPGCRVPLRFPLLPIFLILCATGTSAQDFAVAGARIFDGSQVIENGAVVVRDGRIAAVGKSVELPEGVEVVDGTGKTLLPGWIDCHTHSWGDALERDPVFGVTTVLDMFTEPGWAAERRKEQAEGKADGRADLFCPPRPPSRSPGSGARSCCRCRTSAAPILRE
jgi:hypothetical protein